MRKRAVLLALVPFLLAAAGPAPAAEVKSSSYKGWKSLALDNGLVRLEVVPEIGGRIMQFRLGTNDFFFVNAQLAGKLPPPERLGPGGTWLNYGADKLWPAPQGKGNPEVWPGPPDVVLDAGPYELTVREDSGRAAAIHLLSGKDMRSGIQFSRLVRVEDGSTHVGFDATMTNIDTKPRRWGIWSHTQLDGGKPDGKSPNPLMRAWCPINPESHFPDGYRLMFGPRANPSFQPHALPGLMRVDYLYRVGKIGMDSRAGWVATVNGATGAVFVQRFAFEPGKEYPDGASVEFWHNGTGRIVQPGGKERVYPDDPVENPFVFESEILSPFARLEPGESYTWHYDWYAGNIGGDFPVLDCTDAGIVSEPLAVTEADGRFLLRGRFGVFAPGTLQAVVRDSTGATLQTIDLKQAVGPLKPVLLEAKIESHSGAASVAVVLVDRTGKNRGLLASAEIPLLPCPSRGTLGLRPAGRWEESLVTGNGKMGALVPGGTDREAIILSHERLFLPWEKPIPPPDTAGRLKEIRALLAAGKFQEAADAVVEQSKKEGYGAKRWTDPFIPAFDLVLETDNAGEARRYSRSLDLMTGVADTAWETRAGRFERRVFVSRPDDAVVVSIKGPGAGKLSGRLRLATHPYETPAGIDADYWNAPQKFREGIAGVDIGASGRWLTYRSRFKRSWPGGMQGYEGAAGIFAEGGTLFADGQSVAVSGADEILVLVRIRPLLDFGKSEIPAMQKDLDALSARGYDGLLAPHAKAHGGIFGRVRLDLGGGADRAIPSEQLIARSRVGRLNPALLEKVFDMGRYLILSSSGDWPPALQGIWTGTWGAPWSGDYTQNGNVQSAIASALSGNMAECLESLFGYMDEMMPGYRESARRLFGARGIHVPSRMSTHGLNNHFDRTWPMTFWTAGAAWIARFYYDAWLYTGDRRFLAERAVPFMREAALFYEDFLTIGPDGRYVFSPSYSPENAPRNTRSQSAVNATMDISLARELLMNLISACRALDVEREGIARWTSMLERMPAYAFASDGAVKEWADPRLEDDDAHRHNSHLVALFDGLPPDIAADPRVLEGFRKALDNRMRHRRGQDYREMAFGLVQLGQAATSLKEAGTAYEIVDWLANDYWTSALTPTHEPRSRIVFNVDICGGLPAVVIKMLLASEPGVIDLLPALPAAWPSGAVEGLPCRGQVLVKRLVWDGKRIAVTLRSEIGQAIVLRAPRPIGMISVRSGGAAVEAKEVISDRRTVRLPAGRDVLLELRLTS